MHKHYFNTVRYLNLARVNDSLVHENALLNAKLSTIENSFTANAPPDTNYNYGFTYKPGHVVNNSFILKRNYLTVDVGTRNQVEEKTGVIAYDGIVGIVAGVSENFCRVISILNMDFHVNAKIKETGEVGSVTWDGKNYALVVLNDIPRHVRIKKGMHVIVGPYSKIFPENYPIGIIEEFSLGSGESFYKIKVRLSADIKNISHVYLTHNILLDEQIILEEVNTNE